VACQDAESKITIEMKKPVNTKNLGISDLIITPIGFGAWAVRGPWQFGWGKQSGHDSMAAIQGAGAWHQLDRHGGHLWSRSFRASCRQGAA
jgi:hypothetical protein